MSERPSVEELRAPKPNVLRHIADWHDSLPVHHAPVGMGLSQRLRAHADQLEAEEAAAKAEEQLIEDVARTAYNGANPAYKLLDCQHVPGTGQTDAYRDIARALLAEFVITRREDK